MNINVRSELVPIDSIKPHPQNPRIGDIAAIAESLEVNGQYSPVVVWGDTIIAGTHTWKAAKSLGWKKVAVTHFEGTEDEALRVLITDNRTSDIALYNNQALLDLLKSLPDLEGTGFDTEFLDELDGLHDSSGGVSKPLGDDEDKPEDNPTPPVTLRLGPHRGLLDFTIHEVWLASVKEATGDKKAKIVAEIRARLDVPKEPKAKPVEKKAARTIDLKVTMDDVEMVEIKELRRFPNNPREGDIGAISESLRTLGQYRPVIVNKRNNQILKGNHTVAAASALGWTQVAVAWVDVDDEQAVRIVLADNRTADKATYDNDLLLSVLDKLPTLEGSGFDDDDVADIVRGGNTTPASPKVKFQVGDYSFTTTEAIYQEWAAERSLPSDALHALGLPLSALLVAEDS